MGQNVRASSLVIQTPWGVLLFLLFLALYVFHAAPDVTWGDSGEFASVARTLGIAHPTGYPLYTLIGKTLASVPLSTPARKLNLFSAFCGALSLWLLYELVLAVLGEMKSISATGLPPGVRHLVALMAAATLGVSPVFLSQCLVTEVYALSCLLQLGAWYWLLRWWRGDSSLDGFFMILGLCLAHHLMVLILVPVFLLVILAGLRWCDRSQKQLARSFLFLLPGLLLYLYIPIRAATGPVLNWGEPSSVQRLRWMLQGGDFRGFLLFDPLITEGPGYLLQITQEHLLRLASQFPVFCLLLMASAAGSGLRLFRVIWLAPSDSLHYRGPGLLGILWLGLLFTACFVSFYQTGDREVFFVMTYPLTAVLIGTGLWYGLEAMGIQVQRLKSLLRGGCISLGVAAVLITAVGVLVRTGRLSFERHSARHDRGAAWFGEGVIEKLPAGSLLLVGLNQLDTDNSIYPLWYQKWGMGRGESVVVVGANFLNSPWYRFQLPESGVWFPEPQEWTRLGLVTPVTGLGTVFVSREAWVQGVLMFLKRNEENHILYTLSFIPELRGFYEPERVAEVPVVPGSVLPDYWKFLPDGYLYRLIPRSREVPHP